jgi:recombination protein RecR
MNDSLEKLVELLTKLPGIGPRQARRLAFWLVRRDRSWIEVFAATLLESRNDIQDCAFCRRLFPKKTASELCSICMSEARNPAQVMLVERDVDLENIERTGSYTGRYFVLGGTTSPLEKEPEKKVRIRSLLHILGNSAHPVTEVILALSATSEGEDTILYIEEQIKKIVVERGITVTTLGRGLSTGTELEYVDKDTMDHALKGRR